MLLECMIKSAVIDSLSTCVCAYACCVACVCVCKCVYVCLFACTFVCVHVFVCERIRGMCLAAQMHRAFSYFSTFPFLTTEEYSLIYLPQKVACPQQVHRQGCLQPKHPPASASVKKMLEGNAC
jgi:hypothetical protein